VLYFLPKVSLRPPPEASLNGKLQSQNFRAISINPIRTEHAGASRRDSSISCEETIQNFQDMQITFKSGEGSLKSAGGGI
jgi:hypothetical protein